MGWASAGEIFNPVAQALIDLGADANTKRHVLGTLISKLQDDDWDTEDESLQQFRDDLVIVALFYEHGVGNTVGQWPEGLLGYDQHCNEWTLTCHGGPDACGELARADGDSPAEHDRLVRLWCGHEAKAHDGDGKVPTWMLIDQDGAS